MKKLFSAAVILISVITLSACGGGGGGGGDTTAPTVSSTTPVNNATDVAVNAAVTVTFSEKMDSSTISASSFTLDHSVTGTVTYDETNNIATFTPAANLAYATTYTATITTGVKDAAGNALTADYTWTFTTGVAPDTTAPTVSSTNPANNATSVPINAAITATFSETMDASTITTSTFMLSTGGSNYVVGAVTYAGTTATFTPSANLAYNTTYTATITTGVKDLAGNAMAAEKTWSFTTGQAPDTTPPTVLTTSPVNSATHVALNTAVAANFSEAMKNATITSGTFYLTDKNGNPVTASSVAYSGTTATFTPQSSLAGGMTYTATIKGPGGVQDLAGNFMAADYVWSFKTTVAAPVPSGTPVRMNGDFPAKHMNAVLAFNAAGDKGIAVWYEKSSTANSSQRLLYSMFSSGGWGVEQELALNASNPDVASDGTDFMVVYRYGANYSICAVVVTAAGARGTPATIEAGTGYYPRIVSSGTGKYAVVYSNSSSGYWHFYASMHAGSSWSSPVAVEDSAYPIYAYYTGVIASDGAEYAVAWDGTDGNGKHHAYANISSSGTWSTASVQVLDANNNETSGFSPSIASTGTAGSFGVAWIQYDGAHYSVYGNVATSGTFSTGATLLEQSASEANGRPSIAASSAGYAAAWSQYDGAAYSNYANIYSGGSWSVNSTLLENNNSLAYSPLIASNGTDYAAVWSQYAGNNRWGVYANLSSSNTWSATGTLMENGSGNAWNPAPARKGQDYGIVWQQDNGAGTQIFGKVSSSGVWGTSTSLVTQPWKGAGNYPKMATNSQGTTLAVWQQYVKDANYVYGSINSAGTATWSAPFVFSNSTPAYAAPAVVTNGTDFMVAYDDSSFIYAQPCSSSGVLGTAQKLSNILYNIYNISISSNGSGYAVAWKQYSSGRNNIFANIYDGSAWQTILGTPNPTLLSSGTQNVSYVPAVSSNGSGYAAVWMEYNGSVNDVYAAVYEGSNWQTALIENKAGEAFYNPAIASNGTDYAAAWTQNDSQTNIYVNVFSAGTWSTDGTMASGGVEASVNPSIVSNGTGYASAWRQYNSGGGYYNVFGNVFDGASWAGPLRIDNIAHDAGTPIVASDGSGYAAVWTQDGGTGTYYVYSNKLSGAGVLETASKLETDSTGNAQNPTVVSNGSGYSAAWEKYSSDPIVTDIWVKMGF